MADAADAETEAAAARIRRQARQLPAREPVFVREVCRKLDTDEWGVGSGNRVVMIQGGTGSGKSSQIPQILLDNLGGSVVSRRSSRLVRVLQVHDGVHELGTIHGAEHVRGVTRDAAVGPERREAVSGVVVAAAHVSEPGGGG